MKTTNDNKIRAAVIGCRMGAAHASTIAGIEEYSLEAVCDLNLETAKACAESCGNPAVYTDVTGMLREISPDVLVIATPNSSHASLTFQAVAAGVKGIVCEKPMAVNLADGRKMVQICKENNLSLLVNHQRRMGADLVLLRDMIDNGKLGNVITIRGYCAGDILSDGTHLIDSLLWLAGDAKAQWVLGQIHREPKEESGKAGEGLNANVGFRFGHAVEDGGIATIKLTNNIRLEIACGDMIPDCRAYQDYEIVGSKAMVWRSGDHEGKNLFISDGNAGSMITGVDENYWPLKAIPSKDGTGGFWRPIELDSDKDYHAAKESAMTASYRAFVKTLKDGTPHPLSGVNALNTLEVIMAIYESSRLHKKVTFPIVQDRFPLEIMVESGVL